MDNKFLSLFKVKKPIIGMIHLSGESEEEIEKRAFEELEIYQKEGVDGAIIEDYHGSKHNALSVLKQASRKNLEIILGLNLLSDPNASIIYASQLGAEFIQFDTIEEPYVNQADYLEQRTTFPEIAVLAGVAFKYLPPTGNSLDYDINNTIPRCDAIVTTGSGTGQETPLDKLKEFRRLMPNFPLIVGAGVNATNAFEQFKIVDAAIIGSYFKPNGDTTQKAERARVKEIMDIVKEVRKLD
jgi:predicted TIM-barrel enzyme